MKRRSRQKPTTTGDLILPGPNSQSPKWPDNRRRTAAGGNLDKAYSGMAADEAREASAEEWIEALIGDSHE